MPSATLRSRGRTTIPAQVWTYLGLRSGDRVEFVEIEAGLFAIRAATYSVQSLKVMIRKPRVTVSVEDMNAAIAARGADGR